MLRRRKPAAAPAEPPGPVVLHPGDRVRLAQAPGASEAHQALVGRTGTVERVSGQSVVLRMDRPFSANGVEQRTFYSYARELEPLARVGRLGSEELFEDE